MEVFGVHVRDSQHILEQKNEVIHFASKLEVLIQNCHRNFKHSSEHPWSCNRWQFDRFHFFMRKLSYNAT